VLAAHRAGIKAVVLPKRNEKDLEDVPESVRKVMEFRFVENIGEVFDLALQEAKGEGAEKIAVAEVKRPRRAVRKAVKTPPRQPAMFS